MRPLASSKDFGAPRCAPAARAVGIVTDAALAVGTGVGVAADVPGEPADGASTVTVTVRRGEGMSVTPHEARTHDTATAARTTTARHGIPDRRRGDGRNGDMAKDSRTGGWGRVRSTGWG